ncbi:MAG: NADH dehydrogenase (quinone) subunit G [Nitrospirae bacterium]|nr:MAG: NADH dehydrogenase (quinone) subunit G [Nitrospirota bacterium]
MAEQHTPQLLRVTIDGIAVQVPPGTLVIEAARQVGVMIPHFCYHPKLEPDANCRMCLVEIEKMPRLQTSCSTRVTDGMVVRSNTSPVVQAARKSVLEFILANHPLDCPVCDQGGRCDLQDFSHEYTPTVSRFTELKRIFPKEYFSPLIETQMNRCVQCLRCVRYCDQVMDVKALAPAGRGTMTEIKHFGHHALDCEFCGGCVQICPVGAITSRLSMYEYRPWMLKRTETICPYCGDGCQFTIQQKNNELIEVNSTYGAGRNRGDLCARGYFGYHASTHPDRLRHPLIRRPDGTFREVPWEEALEVAGERLMGIKQAHGGEAIAGLITSRCTNEELYLFQKLMRVVLGTNKIDCSARYGHVNGIEPLRRVQGAHRWTVTFEDIVAADVLLLVGTNITETNPITGLKVKEAVKRRGARLLTLETLLPVRGSISNITTLSSCHIPVHPLGYGQAVNALVKAMIEQNDVAPQIREQAVEFYRTIESVLRTCSWEDLECDLGVSRYRFFEMARIFREAMRAVVLIGQGVLRASRGADIVTNLLDLLLLAGHHQRPGCGLGVLAEENNDQGAVEMGALASYLPGPVSLSDQAACQAIASLWMEELPQGPSATLPEILNQARVGHVRALYVVGENPLASLPPSFNVQEALERVEVLVCQELFLTETARHAHIVLPACSYAEKDGTFTNTEGLVQPVRRAIDPVGESQPDWAIFSALSVVMGYPIEYGSAKEIFKEIQSVIPRYALLGPAPTPPNVHQDVVDRYLHGDFQVDVTQRYTWPRLSPKSEKRLTLILTQSLFHSGKFSTRAKGLLRVQAEGTLLLNSTEAARWGLQPGGMARLSNERGAVSVKVRVLDRVPEGMAFFPEHFDHDIRILFQAEVDPLTQVPCWKQTSVTVEPQ